MKKFLACLVSLSLVVLSTSALAEALILENIQIDIPDVFTTSEHTVINRYTYKSADGELDILYDSQAADYKELRKKHNINIAGAKSQKTEIADLEAWVIEKTTGVSPSLSVILHDEESWIYLKYVPKSVIVDSDRALFEEIKQGISIVTDIPKAEPETTETTETTEEITKEIPDYPTLEKGSKGDEVKQLQQRLIDLYWLNDKADGSYGNKTKDAVQRFQEAAGLEVTGVADPFTQAVLYADDAPEAQMDVSVSLMAVGSQSTCVWYVNGQEFTLRNNQSKTLNTPWGRYVFYGNGYYEKVD